VQALRERVPLYRTFAAPSCRVFPNADNGGPWRVCNYGGGSYGRVSLLEATVNSINVAYAKLILDIGPSDVVRTARAMGIRTNLVPVNSAVLGTNVVNPLGMASAYGTLAAGGAHYGPVAITRIEDADGKVLYKLPTRAKRRQEVIDPSVAYLATNTLEQAVQRGTGTGAIIGRPVAGKTGTAQEYRDAWFVGFTPQRATAVWVGYPEGSISMKTYCFEGPARCRTTRIQVTGGSWPADIWRGFMSAEMKGLPVRGFSAPSSGLLRVAIDTRRNCLATGATPASAQETVTVLQGTSLPDPCPRPAPKKTDGDKDERGKSKSKGDDRGRGRKLGHDKSRGRG
ncbi:MAG: transglycosylase domain-containing protein, partial [Actinomycetota bacterium]